MTFSISDTLLAMSPVGQRKYDVGNVPFIVALVLEELDRLPTVEVFTLSTLPLDPGVVVLVFFESSGWDARRCNCSELAVVTTELPGLGVVAADCEVEIDKLMSPGGTEPLEVTDDEVVVFTIKGPSSIGQVA